MTPNKFVQLLAEAPDLPRLFNPFRDRCLIHDLPDGPEIRRKNLEAYLVAHQRLDSKVLWIAEAASYNGSRRSGLFFIPETQLESASNLRYNISVGFESFGTIGTKGFITYFFNTENISTMFLVKLLF